MNGTMLLLEVGAACLALWAVAVVVHVVILRSVRQRQRELREPLLLISTRYTVAETHVLLLPVCFCGVEVPATAAVIICVKG